MKKTLILLYCLAAIAGCNSNTKSSINNKPESEDSSTSIKKNPLNSAAAVSLYTVPDSFTTQDNKVITLASFKGKPTVVAMIFTNCGYACPKLTSDMQGIAEKLKENADKVNFVLVSFDTERDTPARLKKFADKMKLGHNWTLLHGNDVSVRTLSVLLDVQFEKAAEGNFSHSNLISVLDKNGVLSFQQEGLEADHKATLDTIRALIQPQ